MAEKLEIIDIRDMLGDTLTVIDDKIEVVGLEGGEVGGGAVITVLTLANLRAADRNGLSTAVVNDATGGLFRWTSDITSADDNATIIVPTATTRTGAWKRVIDGVINVRWFGASGNGVTDDTASIQAAIDIFTASTATVPLGGVGAKTIYIPNGIYMISSSLRIKSGHQLVGEGQSAIIKATSTFTDPALIRMVPGVTPHAQQPMLADLGFNDNGKNIWAFKVDPDMALTNALIKNLQFNTGYGVHLGGYAQGCEVTRLFSYGPINQILYLAGNHNRVSWIDKEGGTGTDAVPYAYFKTYSDSGLHSGELYVEGILIEGTGNVNKPNIRFEGFEAVVITNLWVETSNPAPNAIEIVDCGAVRFLNEPTHMLSTRKIYIRNTRLVEFESLTIASEDTAISNVIDIDATSQVHVGTLYTRRNGSLLPISQTANIRVDRSMMQNVAATGVNNTVSYLADRGQENFLQNGSFEAGSYGWTFQGTVTSSTFVQSRFGRGLMARYQFNNTAVLVYQVVTIPAELIGRLFTFRISINIDAPAYATIVTNGAGVSQDDSSFTGHSAYGPQHLTTSFIPTVAGNINVGVRIVALVANTSNVELDNAILSCGTEPATVPSSSSIQLGGQTITTAASIPTTGTWKVGDKVYFTAPIAGGYIGATCVTAGTPGTWTSFGGDAVYPVTTTETAQTVTPTNLRYSEGDVRRYGAVLNGTTDDTTPFRNAIKVLANLTWTSVSKPAVLTIPSGYAGLMITDRINIPTKVALICDSPIIVSASATTYPGDGSGTAGNAWLTIGVYDVAGATASITQYTQYTDIKLWVLRSITSNWNAGDIGIRCQVAHCNVEVVNIVGFGIGLQLECGYCICSYLMFSNCGVALDIIQSTGGFYNQSQHYGGEFQRGGGVNVGAKVIGVRVGNISNIVGNSVYFEGQSFELNAAVSSPNEALSWDIKNVNSLLARVQRVEAVSLPLVRTHVGTTNCKFEFWGADTQDLNQVSSYVDETDNTALSGSNRAYILKPAAEAQQKVVFDTGRILSKLTRMSAINDMIPGMMAYANSAPGTSFASFAPYTQAAGTIDLVAGTYDAGTIPLGVLLKLGDNKSITVSADSEAVDPTVRFLLYDVNGDQISASGSGGDIFMTGTSWTASAFGGTGAFTFKRQKAVYFRNNVSYVFICVSGPIRRWQITSTDTLCTVIDSIAAANRLITGDSYVPSVGQFFLNEKIGHTKPGASLVCIRGGVFTTINATTATTAASSSEVVLSDKTGFAEGVVFSIAGVANGPHTVVKITADGAIVAPTPTASVSGAAVTLVTPTFSREGGVLPVTTTLTPMLGDVVLCTTTSSAVSVTLPANPVSGGIVTVKDNSGNANTNNITITPASGSIEGQSTLVLKDNWAVVRLVWNGSLWIKLGADLVNTTPLTTTLHLYVNSATGNDASGDGSSLLPFATFARAAKERRKYRLKSGALLVIHLIGVGPYTWDWEGPNNIEFGASVTIIGDSQTTHATYTKSTTFNATTLTCTTNQADATQHRGRFVRYLDGNMKGEVSSIVNTGVGTLQILYPPDVDVASASVEIFSPTTALNGVYINGELSRQYAFKLANLALNTLTTEVGSSVLVTHCTSSGAVQPGSGAGLTGTLDLWGGFNGYALFGLTAGSFGTSARPFVGAGITTSGYLDLSYTNFSVGMVISNTTGTSNFRRSYNSIRAVLNGPATVIDTNFNINGGWLYGAGAINLQTSTAVIGNTIPFTFAGTAGITVDANSSLSISGANAILGTVTGSSPTGPFLIDAAIGAVVSIAAGSLSGATGYIRIGTDVIALPYANAINTGAAGYVPTTDTRVFFKDYEFSFGTTETSVRKSILNVRATSLPAALTGSAGYSPTTASAQTDFDVQKNGVSIGTIRFASGASTATFIAASASNFAISDRTEVISPANLNGLGPVLITLKATLT